MRAPEFWTRDSAAAKAWAALLSPLGALYGMSVRARQAQARPFRPKATVLCIGNLTAGGSGKTPIAIALGRTLSARGIKIAFLSRGYGGRLRGPVQVDPFRHSAADVGDEPLLFAAHAATIVARDRAKGAQLADRLGFDIIVMDDGFQNFQIAKDVSLIVIDSEIGFGNGGLIPAGPLREPVAQGLARADAIVLFGERKLPLPGFAGPILRARIVPTMAETIRGRRVFAFAGIGRPEKFFATLRDLGATLAGTRALPDHHKYGALELSLLKKAAEAAGALLVTTEKDYARLEPAARQNVHPVAVHAVFEGSAIPRLLDMILEARNVAVR